MLSSPTKCGRCVSCDVQCSTVPPDGLRSLRVKLSNVMRALHAAANVEKLALIEHRKDAMLNGVY
jgi:hypothetical protein